jgi:hypothetical protein
MVGIARGTGPNLITDVNLVEGEDAQIGHH